MQRIGIFVGISVSHRSEVASVIVTRDADAMHFAIVRHDAIGAMMFSRRRARTFVYFTSSRFNNRNGNRCGDHVVKAATFR